MCREGEEWEVVVSSVEEAVQGIPVLAKENDEYRVVFWSPHRRLPAMRSVQPSTASRKEAGVVTKIADLCSIYNLRNQKVNKYGLFGGDVKISHESFFRKGMVGDWTNHMTLEMAERLDPILREKLDGSELIV
uniref:Sulfotransferase n=1 Tax=Oryza punctata TaxID=4537 RepID=A0A0E0LTG6_ORYPU